MNRRGTIAVFIHICTGSWRHSQTAKAASHVRCSGRSHESLDSTSIKHKNEMRAGCSGNRLFTLKFLSIAYLSKLWRRAPQKPDAPKLIMRSALDGADCMHPVVQLPGRCLAAHDLRQRLHRQLGQASQAAGRGHERPEVGLRHTWQPPQHIDGGCVHHRLRAPTCWQPIRAHWHSCTSCKPVLMPFCTLSLASGDICNAPASQDLSTSQSRDTMHGAGKLW